ncbi:MAG: DnaD domain protein [Lachnospiraceae bacterium]|nr:DnaD domain protein [Lachnospiraceae bacterium]
MEELYNSLYANNVTIISNEFLDKYLSDTDPKYIKVFLFYLWKGLKEGYTISETSSEIDLAEDVVEMALKYWIRKKIMKKDCLIKERSDKNTSEKNVKIESKIESKIEAKQKDTTDNLVDFQTKKKELINKNRPSYSEIEKNLLFVAERLLGQTLSERQQALIAKCYNEYNFEEGLIHYLLEYCSNKSSTNVKYMSAIATSWYEEGIKSVEEAKKFTDSFVNHNKSDIKQKKRVNTKIVDRDEYNKMFKENLLQSNK